jgi:hypothetical protein
VPRYILHIGAHKTGTTYLQRIFHTLRPALETEGIAFPACWSQSDDQPSHQKLYAALIAGAAGALQADFEAIAGDEVLISSEDFSYLREPHLLQLRTILGDAPVTILFYCRRWSEMLPSVWQERIKHGFSETFPQFAAAVAKDPNRLDFVNFGNILDRYAAVFGKDCIRIVPYSNLTDSGTDIAEHFADTFQPKLRPLLAHAGDILGTRPNQSLHPAETEVVRTLNAMHTAAGGERGSAVRIWFLREGHRHGAAELLDAVGRRLQALRLSDQQPELEALHRQLWSTYGNAVVPPRREDRFFTPMTRDIPVVPPLASLTALYQAFRVYSG